MTCALKCPHRTWETAEKDKRQGMVARESLPAHVLCVLEPFVLLSPFHSVEGERRGGSRHVIIKHTYAISHG